jgi:hypothetical protein
MFKPLRYGIVYLGAAIGVQLVLFGLGLLGASAPVGLTALIAVIIAALNEGMLMGRAGATVSGGTAWKAAFAATVTVAVINTAALALLYAIIDRAPLAGEDLTIYAALVAAFAVILLLVNRLMLAMGAKAVSS